MNARALALVAAAASLVSVRAFAAPLVVVVRSSGDDALVIARLRGQLADLDVALIVAPGAVEQALDAQLASAAELATARGARAVVWFIARGNGLAVAVATPADQRLFVREIGSADPSAVAEAAAVVVRGAIRAIGEGGTIGVDVETARRAERDRQSSAAPPRAWSVELAVGWQAALDAGADAGAHAIAQRTSVRFGAWASSLALTLGPPLRHAAGSGVAIELSRSSAALGFERRYAGFALAASAGALLYSRTTVATEGDLMATPSARTLALLGGAELRWCWRCDRIVGVEASVGVDVVVGAPELAVSRGGVATPLSELGAVQPRAALMIVMGLP